MFYPTEVRPPTWRAEGDALERDAIELRQLRPAGIVFKSTLVDIWLTADTPTD